MDPIAKCISSYVDEFVELYESGLIDLNEFCSHIEKILPDRSFSYSREKFFVQFDRKNLRDTWIFAYRSEHHCFLMQHTAAPVRLETGARAMYHSTKLQWLDPTVMQPFENPRADLKQYFLGKEGPNWGIPSTRENKWGKN